MWQTVPFPLADIAVALRPFGYELRDLSVDFSSAERPWLITRVLSGCTQTSDGRTVPEETIWELPVSTRIAAVVALAGAVSARPLEWRVRCCYTYCGSDGSLELEPAEILAFAAEKSRQPIEPLRIGSHALRLRRPTGSDQQRWLEAGVGLETLAADLVVEPAPKLTLDEITRAIDRVMEEYDPLVYFRVEVGCAQCGRSTEHTLDLTAAALERLWEVQLDLVDQVHRLASHYHWTEEEIDRVPHWRRQAYLDRIGGEA
jgi:hypothetical protein